VFVSVENKQTRSKQIRVNHFVKTHAFNVCIPSNQLTIKQKKSDTTMHRDLEQFPSDNNFLKKRNNPALDWFLSWEKYKILHHLKNRYYIYSDCSNFCKIRSMVGWLDEHTVTWILVDLLIL